MSTNDNCVYCGESTAFGSGKFVNRLSVDEGWGCAECSGFECDRCGTQIDVDFDVKPRDCGLEEFADGSSYICEDCLTTDERSPFRTRRAEYNSAFSIAFSLNHYEPDASDAFADEEYVLRKVIIAVKEALKRSDRTAGFDVWDTMQETVPDHVAIEELSEKTKYFIKQLCT
tara:strand:+ start:821 stop:1336 length:516 start_codon:yes stop_codon:yes gene_type:complete